MRVVSLKWSRLAAWACVLTMSVTAGVAQELRLTRSDDDLQGQLQAAAQSLSLPEDTPPAEIVAAAQGDYARLVSVLYADGFYGPSVSITLAGREASSLSSLRPPARVSPVIVSIDQGPAFLFGTARVAPLPPELTLPDTFQPGRTARTARIRDAAQTALDGWRAASHAKAEIVRTDIVARHRTQRLDANIVIAPGPALRFGRLVVPQDRKVRAERLLQIAGLPTGAPYTPDDLRRARARLVDTGAFRSVVLAEADSPNADGTLDVRLQVEDAPQRRLGFGAEISSDEGLSVEGFWLHRNLFGGAERLRISLDIDGIDGTASGDGLDYALGATLTIPGFRRPDDTLTVYSSVERLDEPAYLSDVFLLGVARARDFDDRRSASIGAGLRLAETEDAFGARSFRHIIFDAEGTYDGRDDTLAPRSGQFVNFGIKPFLGIDGSDTGVRLFTDYRAYVPLGARTVLAGRMNVGAVFGPKLADTPPEFLFLSGGGGTVRGQEFQSLGVDLPAGLVGGRSFVGLSAELRQELGGSFGVVGFVDYGYVAEANDFTGGDDHAGFGLGARYATGLGALRVDLATQATGDVAENLFLYIGIGEAF